jgi:hypothetical protein
LSFKIILIQKCQIFVFGKYLNLSIFENEFDLDLNFGFKLQEKFKNNFYFSLGAQSCFRCITHVTPTHLPFSFLIYFSFTGPPAHSARLANWPTQPSVPSPLSSHGTAMPPVQPAATASSTASAPELPLAASLVPLPSATPLQLHEIDSCFEDPPPSHRR